MRLVSFYDETTGILDPNHFIGSSDEIIAVNTPKGHRVIDGHHDHLSMKVDLTDPENPVVIDHQPPQPSPDHEWVDRRWVLKADIQAQKQNRERALGSIHLLEQLQARAVREFLLDLTDLGNHPAMDRLRTIEAEIATHRRNLK